jgi:putative dimethyl sulfoxide reductase chaperone
MTDELQDDLATIVAHRRTMYAWLARIYRHEIDQAFLDALGRMDLTVGTGVAALDTGYQILSHFVSHRNEQTLTDLAVDFARIFVGVRKSASAFPYESVYTSPDRLIMQDARDRAVRFYRGEGVKCTEDLIEPEDHIGFELEFMALLCQRTEEALARHEKGSAAKHLRRQFEFLERHLLRWVPDFCRDVERVAQSDFYKASAEVTNGFIQVDYTMLRELIHELERGAPNGQCGDLFCERP